MENKLPVKTDNSLIGKIKKFFRNIFTKNHTEFITAPENTNELQNTEKIIKENNKKDVFEQNIKLEFKDDYLKEMKREEFLDEIEKNPSIIYQLPIEKLRKLDEYYNYSINMYEEKIDKLKKSG